MGKEKVIVEKSMLNICNDKEGTVKYNNKVYKVAVGISN